jgi:hypothetical protein
MPRKPTRQRGRRRLLPGATRRRPCSSIRATVAASIPEQHLAGFGGRRAARCPALQTRPQGPVTQTWDPEKSHYAHAIPQLYRDGHPTTAFEPISDCGDIEPSAPMVRPTERKKRIGHNCFPLNSVLSPLERAVRQPPARGSRPAVAPATIDFRLGCSVNTKAERGGNQKTLPESTREAACGSSATLVAILASAVCSRIDDFFRLPIK